MRFYQWIPVPIAVLFVFATSLLMSGCAMRPQVDNSRINMVTCKYTFANTEREDADRIANVIERYRLDHFPFYMNVGNDSIYCEFTIGNLTDVDMMHRDLKYLPHQRSSADRNRYGGKLVFAEFKPILNVSYRAVLLEGGLQMTLKFTISPGARLFYAGDGDFEIPVEDIYIDEYGQVEMPISVREGQRYIYGRTMLGDVIKCIRIYIYTGETEEISLDEYRTHVRFDPDL